MGDIFVSYSRHDQETVDRIVEAIKQAGMNVWIDREETRGGEESRVAIVEAIDNADALVLILSPNSVDSELVRKEVALAEGSNKDLVPVLLARVQLPAQLRYQLAGLQWIEYYQDPEAKLAELVKVLREHETKPVTEQSNREVELVIKGIDPSKFGPAEQKKLLDLIAELIDVPRADISAFQVPVFAGKGLAGDTTTDAPPPTKKKKDK